MKAHKKHKKKGFTLIEVVVTIALIGIIIPVIYNFISFGGNVFSKGTSKAESQNDVNLIAYKISNQLRTVSEISLTAKTGYTEYNVKSEHPNIDGIAYTLSKVNDTYMLNFSISESTHQVVSEIALNNVALATTGSTNDKIWVLNAESISLKPTIVLGNASELFRKGDPTKTITFPVKTTNIPNNALLTAELLSAPIGLEIPTSPIVITNNAVLQLKVFSNAEIGSYEFKLSYPGADDVLGTIQVLDQVNLYTITFNKNGGNTEANPSSLVVQEGVSIGPSMPTPPARTGYTFTGWNTAANGSGSMFDENTLVTSNATLYAMWASSGQPLVTSVKITKIGNATVDISASNSPRVKVKKGSTIKMVVTVLGNNLNVATISASGSNVSSLSITSSAATTMTLEFTLIAHNGNKVNEDVTINILNSGTNISQTKFYFVTEN